MQFRFGLLADTHLFLLQQFDEFDFVTIDNLHRLELRGFGVVAYLNEYRMPIY